MTHYSPHQLEVLEPEERWAQGNHSLGYNDHNSQMLLWDLRQSTAAGYRPAGKHKEIIN